MEKFNIAVYPDKQGNRIIIVKNFSEHQLVISGNNIRKASAYEDLTGEKGTIITGPISKWKNFRFAVPRFIIELDKYPLSTGRNPYAVEREVFDYEK